MQREEPSACLVNTLGNEVGRIKLAIVKTILVFKRIVDLCVWHGTGIEPHVDQVGLAVHRAAAG